MPEKAPLLINYILCKIDKGDSILAIPLACLPYRSKAMSFVLQPISPVVVRGCRTFTPAIGGSLKLLRLPRGFSLVETASLLVDGFPIAGCKRIIQK